MTGMSIAVSVLVGQRLGGADSASAERATLSAVHLAAVFFAFAGLVMIVSPQWFIEPFARSMDLAVYEAAVPLVKTLLRLVAVFCIFESVSMMMAGALKGAGDTRFVAWIGIGSTWLVLVLPTALLVYIWGGDLIWSWVFFVLNGFIICLVHWLRFRAAKWKLLRVTI